MKRALLTGLFLICGTGAMAQDAADTVYEPSMSGSEAASADPTQLEKPLGRVKSTTEVNTESSSFMGDPDNIDPLRPRNESLREDEEPVLQDITGILDAPAKAASGDGSGRQARKKSKVRSPDRPDLRLEKRFHDIYNRYNSTPTPEDVWQAASSKQQQRQYVVQKGDTLWSISKILFGDPLFWPKLWALNKQGILNPHFIQPNTIIYFYAGDSENSPTLSVGSPGPVRQDGGGSGDGGPMPQEQGPVVADGVIPDSLPLSKNLNYFENKKRELKIELGSFPTFPYEYSDDIVITDAPVKTTVKIQISEVAKFRCYDGRLIKAIRYVGDLQGEYEVFEPLDSFESASGTLHAYRAYGRAVPYEGKYLKIMDCNSVIATDLVFLPKGRMETLKTQKISTSRSAKLVGGPNVASQRLFSLNQKAYVDFGSFPYEEGQDYKIQSQVTDSVNGEIKVLKKNGSFAVVIITALMDVMEIGDKVILSP